MKIRDESYGRRGHHGTLPASTQKRMRSWLGRARRAPVRLVLVSLILINALLRPSLLYAQAPQILTSISSDQLKELLQQTGFTNVRIDEDDDLIVRMQGYNVLILVRGSKYTRIQYAFGLSSDTATLEDINAWNESKLFTKAYLDDEGDPVLEMDVDLEGGVTIDRVINSIVTFNVSLGSFLSHMAK